MDSPDVIVVGGGIAGLAAAWRWAEEGASVRLFEQESLLASHSSARNAAIWMPMEDDPTTSPLARRSAALLDGLLEERWLRPTGGLVVAPHEAGAAAVERAAAGAAMAVERVSAEHAAQLSPALIEARRAGGRSTSEGGAIADEGAIFVYLPGAGELDIHAITTGLARAAQRLGARLELGAPVRSLLIEREAVAGVSLADGSRMCAPRIVLAAGAWVGALAAAAGVPLPIAPYRRHLLMLQADARLAGCIVWRLDEEVYFRPDTVGVLASPCDEELSEPCLPIAADWAGALLAEKLERRAPGLMSASVRRSWACLRTFAADRELVIGGDPRVAGLDWLAGFGGRGMTVAVGAAALGVDGALGRASDLLEITSPARLLS